MKVFIALATLVSMAMCAPDSIGLHGHATHGIAHGPVAHGHGGHGGYGAPATYDDKAYYNYGYAVNDDYSGVDMSKKEARDGYATTGSYSVALPDGRTQIVNYNVADAYSGYVADVQYEGYAKEYVPTKPAYHQPAYTAPKPAYQAATPAYHTPKYSSKPAYNPAPIYHA